MVLLGSIDAIDALAWAEVSTPTAAHHLPPSTKPFPYGTSGEVWYASHTKINRQGGASGVEAIRCIRVDLSLAYLAPVSRNDEDSWPTNPGPGKLLMRPCLKRDHHRSQVRVQYPSSLQATSIGAYPKRQHLGQGRRGIIPSI